LTNRAAEHVVRLPDVVIGWMRWRRDPAKLRQFTPGDYLFPYAVRHRDKPYSEKLTAFVHTLTGCECNVLPQTQPFSTCKRFLRLTAPPLWEELEHVEGEVRMLGSFFVAMLVSALIACVGFVANRVPLAQGIPWLVASLALAAVFALAFRAQREREVSVMYLNALIASSWSATHV
jgi:hypothetical protein